MLLLLLLGRCERSRLNFALGLQAPDLQNISRQIDNLTIILR